MNEMDLIGEIVNRLRLSPRSNISLEANYNYPLQLNTVFFSYMLLQWDRSLVCFWIISLQKKRFYLLLKKTAK